MFSKEESRKIKKDFWILFGKRTSYHKRFDDRKKWILYDTKIKGFSLKFEIDNKFASVMFEIDMPESKRILLYNELCKYENLLKLELEHELFLEQNYLLRNGKTVSRIYTEMLNISIHNKNDWEKLFDYFINDMTIFENLFVEIREVLLDVININ